MKRFYVHIITLVLIALFGLGAVAATQVEQLEQRIRGYLDTVMNPDDYLLYVVEKRSEKISSKDSSSKSENLLGVMPGMMGSEGRAGETFMDSAGMTHEIESGPLGPVSVNLVVDKRVNRQKLLVLKNSIMSIAHLNSGAGDEIKISQASIGKELPRLPQESRESQRTWIDSLADHQKVIFAVMFAILISVILVTLIFGLVRHYFPDASGENKGESDGKSRGAAEKAEAINAAAAEQKAAENQAPQAPKRDALYSKDSAIFKLVNEILDEAKTNPKKVASVISQWLQQGEEWVQRAAVFFQNFDIKTAESIGKELTPSDMELLGKQVILDFDMFSEDNIRVVLHARQDLTKLASFSTKVKHSEPLKFLHLVNDDILVELLRDETPENLALILTQIPAHRLSNFLNALEGADVDEIFDILSKTEYVDEERFAPISKRLQKRIEEFSHFAFTPKTKETVMVNMIKQFSSTEQQRHLLDRLTVSNQDLGATVRENIVLYEDIFHLPERQFKLVLQDMDPQVMAKACRNETPEVVASVMAALPKAFREIFEYEMASTVPVAPEDLETAKQTLLAKMHELLSAGVVRFEDIKAARKFRSQQQTRYKESA